MLLWFILHFYPGFQYLSQMKKAARDMMSGLKLGPGSSHGHFEVYHDANPIREGDGKVYEGVGLEIAHWSGLHRCNLSLQRGQPT